MFDITFYDAPVGIGAGTGTNILSGDLAKLSNSVPFVTFATYSTSTAADGTTVVETSYTDNSNFVSSASYSNTPPSNFYDSAGSYYASDGAGTYNLYNVVPDYQNNINSKNLISTGVSMPVGSALPSNAQVTLVKDSSGHYTGETTVAGLTPGDYSFFVTYTDIYNNIVTVQDAIHVVPWTLPFTGGEGAAGLVGLAGLAGVAGLALMKNKKKRRKRVESDVLEESGYFEAHKTYGWTGSVMRVKVTWNGRDYWEY
jgi:MYXO-CTERM domain-containing protein